MVILLPRPLHFKRFWPLVQNSTKLDPRCDFLALAQNPRQPVRAHEVPREAKEFRRAQRARQPSGPWSWGSRREAKVMVIQKKYCLSKPKSSTNLYAIDERCILRMAPGNKYDNAMTQKHVCELRIYTDKPNMEKGKGRRPLLRPHSTRQPGRVHARTARNHFLFGLTPQPPI